MPSLFPPMRDHFLRHDSSETSCYESSVSSGLTTPADEEMLHPFDLVVVQEDYDDPQTPRPPVPEPVKQREVTAPKARTLSRAVTKAKQFAQTLTRSNKSAKRPNATSLILPTPASIRSYDMFYNLPLEHPNVIVQADDVPDLNGGTPLFSLPNAGIERSCIEEVAVNPADMEIELPAIATMEDISTKLRSGTIPTPDVAQGETAALPAASSIEEFSLEILNVTPRRVLILLARVICFIPWCIAVGGAIILCPSQMEFFAFTPGYQASLQGIHRFAYWADCAMQHVAIFFAFIAALGWWSRPLGAFLAASILMCFLLGWGDFVLDRTIPLGDDDRQTFYLVFTNYGLGEQSLNMQKTAAGYLLFDGVMLSDTDVIACVE